MPTEINRGMMMANMQGKTIKNFGFHVDSLNFFPIVGIKGIYIGSCSLHTLLFWFVTVLVCKLSFDV